MSSGASKPEPAKGAVPHLWREELRERPAVAERPAAASEARSAVRRRRVFRILSVMLGLAGVIVGMMSWLRPLPEPAFFPIWVAKYQSPLVPIPNQSDRDRNAFREGRYFSRTNPDAYTSQELAFLTNELAGLAQLSGSRSVVVYLGGFAAGGMVQEGGQSTPAVFILPGDVVPDQPSSKLALRQVLEALRACPARRKLLILDIMRPLARLGEPGIPPGRLGLLADDVASRIEGELATVPDPNRLVLAACAPGQFSLNSEVMGRSVFSYYVEAGLRGSAEGWGPDSRQWGRVDISELAAFVRDRVDQWAWTNRGRRQTPKLYGDGPNFQLTSLEHGEGAKPPALIEAQTYPSFLFQDFQKLDQWRADGSYRIRPRTYRQLEAWLLRQEQSWRGGTPATSVESVRKPILDALLKEYAEGQQMILHPDPRSLALAVAQGRRPDAKVADAVQALVQQVKIQTQGLPPEKAQPVIAKLTDEFWKKQQATDVFNLSSAVFSAALGETRPAPDLLRFLDGLLQTKTPVPHYVETLCLHQVAELGQTAGDWPAETVHRLLLVTALGEQAASQFRAFEWLRGPLAQADQARFNAEYLFWSRGYAPMADADRLLRFAQDQYGQVLALEDNLLTALKVRDEALALLPDYLAYLDRLPPDERAWFNTVESAIELVDLLEPSDGGPLTPEALRQRSDAWRQHSAALSDYLTQLRRPFTADSQTLLIKATKQPTTQASVAAEIDAMLRTTLLSAEDRTALWKAGIQTARELVTASLQADEQVPMSGSPLLPDVDQLQQERDRRQQADLRARMAIALLRLGGLAAADIQQLEDARARWLRQSDRASLDALGTLLQHTWAEKLPAQLAAETNLYRRDRLGWLVPPFDTNRILDEASTNPTLVMEIAQTRALWDWLAETYRQRSRDLPGSGFWTEVAREYQALIAQPAVRQAGLQIATTSPLPRLTPTQPSGSLAVQLSLPQSAGKTSVEFNVISPASDWLQVRPEIEGAAQQPQGPWTIELDNAAPRTIWLRLALQPGAESASLGPLQGFLITAKLGERTYFHRVTLAVLPLGNRPEIILSADPNSPTGPVGAIRLRTVKAPQPIFVYVRNPTDKPFTFNGDIRGSDGGTLASVVKVPLAPREVKRIAFTAPPAAAPPATPAPAAKELPELKGPLQIRLVDAASPGTVFDVRQVDVDIALPREYVQVSNIAYAPADFAVPRPSQLSAQLRAASRLAGPPCLIELVLPPSRIPGFLGAKEGTFRGELPPPSQELSLFARNLVFNEGSPRDGTIYFNVDGYARAFLFRTTFVASGDAVTPQQDYRPGLRLQAERYAQANNKYQVTLEVDNAPAGASLDLALGLNVGGVFQPELTKKLPEARRRRIGFQPDGPGGALLFDADIQDWTLTLDTSLILGPRSLRARLLDAAGAEILVVTQDITLVNAAPAGVQIIQAPKQAAKGAPLTLQALGFDNQSGIQQVQFFLGKPMDGQLPPKITTFPATPTSTDGNIWSAQVPIPENAAGPVDVSVQFTNKAGLSSFATTTVQVVDKLVPQAARIVGRLMEGPRPQAGLLVQLNDEKGMKLKETKTDADGTFAFEDVAPGHYVLTAQKEISGRKAHHKVVLKPGAEAKVTLELLF